MEIILKRNEGLTFHTGTITIAGQHICDTAENARTALPPGRYPVHLIKCHQYGRKMPVVHPELACPEPVEGPKCESCEKMKFVCNNSQMPQVCPMLKPGNGVHHREDGSILVGTRLIPGCLKHPQQAFTPLYQRIRKNLERGNSVTLVIV